MTTRQNVLDQYRQLHAAGGDYGSTSIKRAPYILPHVRALRPSSVIDYGCGTSRLWTMIAACCPDVRRYDPAIPELAGRPEPADLLISVDVLEHIHEPDLDGIIADMAALSKRAVIIIDHHIAKTILPNGQNAHATIKPAAWWQERLQRHYPYVERIRGVRRRPASFRTWRMTSRDRLAVGLQIAMHRVLQLAGLQKG